MTDTEHNEAATRTHLHKRWVVRMVLITVVLWAFGAWGFYDAVIKYPATGRAAAEGLQLDYLTEMAKEGRVYDAPIVDPVGTLAELRGKDMLELSVTDRAKLDWLNVLDTPGLGLLNAEHTRMNGDPQAEYERLAEIKRTGSFPPALSHWDIMVQWGICGVCWALGTFMLVLFVMVKSRVYRWEPAAKALTLPGGRTLGPDDLDREDPADLSKWHKFVVFLRPKEGGPIKLDLFRYEPLEDWVRVLVKSANEEFEFPDEGKEPEATEDGAAEDAGAESAEEAADEAGDAAERDGGS